MKFSSYLVLKVALVDLKRMQLGLIRRGTTLHTLNAEGRYDDWLEWRQFIRSSITDEQTTIYQVGIEKR